MDIFERASRVKLRFPTTKGAFTTEDLWNVRLEDLDTIAKGLNREIKATEEESFIAKKTTANEALELKFEIVKHIIKVKLEEKEAKALAAERQAKKQRIVELIGKKEDAVLEGKSLEELKKELQDLD